MSWSRCTASGIGLATASSFAKAGMTVVVADIDVAKANDAAASLPGSGHCGVGVDVADEVSVAALFGKVEAEIGPVGVLAHYAGVSGFAADGVKRTISE